MKKNTVYSQTSKDHRKRNRESDTKFRCHSNKHKFDDLQVASLKIVKIQNEDMDVIFTMLEKTV